MISIIQYFAIILDILIYEQTNATRYVCFDFVIRGNNHLTLYRPSFVKPSRRFAMRMLLPTFCRMISNRRHTDHPRIFKFPHTNPFSEHSPLHNPIFHFDKSHEMFYIAGSRRANPSNYVTKN